MRAMLNPALYKCFFFFMGSAVVVVTSLSGDGSNRLMRMCRLMGSHFHDWIDYNGVAFSIEFLGWGRIFSGVGGKNILASREFR